jgi:hypothetical protein
MDKLDICVECEKPKADLDFLGRCPGCFEELKWRPPKAPVQAPYFKEMGVENPVDPKGSTAHVRDIKSRRYDEKTDSMYRYHPPKRYFFPNQKGA